MDIFTAAYVFGRWQGATITTLMTFVYAGIQHRLFRRD